MDHDHLNIGPLYCETPLIATSFPLEFINALTSLIPALLGILAALWLWRTGRKEWTLYALSFLLFATGIGSTLWHALRTPLSLSLDVFPGLLFFLVFTFLWPLYLKNRWWAYGTVIGLFTTVFVLTNFVSLPSSNGPPFVVFLATALFAFGLIYVTYRTARPATVWAVLMILSALAAAFFRTIDLKTCDIVPFGTHFLWHVFLGLAGFLAIVTLAKIKSLQISKIENR